MGSSKKALLPQLFLLVTTLAVLGIVIAVLVIIVNVQNQQNNIYAAINSPPSTGLPPVQSLNIPPLPKISAQDDHYSAYNLALKEFQYSVNFSADPCNDFYSYACSNYQKEPAMSDMAMNNYQRMQSQLTSPDYKKVIDSSTALQKEKQFYDACVAIYSDSALDNKTLVSKDYLMTKVKQLKAKLGSDFTIVFGGTVKNPSSKQLGDALGYLSFEQGIDTYITPTIDTYWKDNTRGYQFFIDQNTAEKSKTYYSPSAFATIKDNYIASTTNTLKQFCTEQGQACPDLKAKVTELINFEQVIAYNYSTDDNTRRQSERSWNPMTVSKMANTYTFIDWSAYLANAPEVARDLLVAPGYSISVMEPNMTLKLSNDLSNMSQEMVTNYLYMRLILDSSQYLPDYSSSFSEMESFKFGKGRSDRRQVRSRRAQLSQQAGLDCIEMADDLMTYANGRVFIDNIYPGDKSKKAIRDTAGGLIKNVINSFQGMLEQLDWMDDETKLKALDKTNNIVKNIAFPDWILDNNQLDNYYQNLAFGAQDNFYDMWDTLIRFNIFLQYQQLKLPATIRTDFQMGPGITNAWYAPEFNSITLSAGMLQPPFFHENFPASVNYGGIGIVSGHELTHGFDDEGVQWGPTGDLATWMDDNSTEGFQNMAKCVIKEYNSFCPLDASQFTPNCVNGQQTQGENIADNGGIHAAFRAYRTHIALDGPDPTLDDPIFGQFTHDQLFFLNYGQIWCGAKPSDASVYRQLMVDPHSPALYRVFGSIQNFPAFRVAYNCPVGSTYSPKEHCKVWVPNVEA